MSDPTRDGPRICHVNFARGYRGGERQTELLVRALAAVGVPQCVIARRDDELARRLRGTIPGVELREARRPFLMSARQGRDCVIHAHEARAAHFAHACYRWFGSPYVVTRRINRLPGGGLTRHVYRKAGAVVAVAHAVAEGLRRYEPTLSPHVIHSAVSQLTADPARVAKLRARWPGRFVIGNIGALDQSQKGQSHLIRAARELSGRHADLRFVICGSGPDEARFRGEAQDLPNLAFEGYVTNVGDYLSAFDLFVLPSLHEGIGGILLDAMSFGVPVIASAVDGLPEIVQDGINGLLVPPADEAALANAIERLRGDADLRRRMGAEGRRIAADYSPQHMAQRYLAVYRSIVEQTQ